MNNPNAHINVFEAVIPANGTQSNPVDLTGLTLCGVIVPGNGNADIPPASLEVSVNEGASWEFLQLFTTTNGPIPFNLPGQMQAALHLAVPPNLLAAQSFIRVKSEGSPYPSSLTYKLVARPIF